MEKTTEQKLVEARQLLGRVSRACRQTIAYFGGISVLDERKVMRMLQDAVRDIDRHLKV